jgi:transposase-like protein
MRQTISDDRVRKLAQHCLDTGESYSKVATEHGIGKGRIKKFIDELRDTSIKKPLSKHFELHIKQKRKPTLGKVFVVTFEDGSQKRITFSQEVVDFRKEGDLL